MEDMRGPGTGRRPAATRPTEEGRCPNYRRTNGFCSIIKEAVGRLVLDEQAKRALIDQRLRDKGWDAKSIYLRDSKGMRPAQGQNIAVAKRPTKSSFLIMLCVLDIAASTLSRLSSTTLTAEQSIHQRTNIGAKLNTKHSSIEEMKKTSELGESESESGSSLRDGIAKANQ